MLALRTLGFSALLLTIAGCPGPAPVSTRADTGRDASAAPDVTIPDAPAFDSPGTSTDAPGADTTLSTVDAPGLDAPGVDAHSTLDARTALEAGSDAPGADSPPPVSRICGARTGVVCRRGEFCNIPPENSCGRTDGTGVCTMIPPSCTRELNPQCGCDGMPYGNPCLAALASVSIDYPGACRADGPSCDVTQALCDVPAPRCRLGLVPSVEGACWGPCVEPSTCVCATTDECPVVPGVSEVCIRGRCGALGP